MKIDFTNVKSIISDIHVHMTRLVTVPSHISITDEGKVKYATAAGAWLDNNKVVDKYSLNGYIRDDKIIIPCMGIDITRVTFIFKLVLFVPRHVQMHDLTDYDHSTAPATHTPTTLSDYDRAMRGVI